MSQKLTWDAPEDREYEYGVSKVVLFPTDDNGAYLAGVAWNGATNITDKPEGGEMTEIYADNIEYAAIPGVEKYGIGIEAFTYPDEFAECDGTVQPIVGMTAGQQTRKKFGLCWRTEIGNANTSEAGYKIHIAYGIRVTPAEKAHDTVNESPEAGNFSWDGKGTPVPIANYKPTAKLEFSSLKLSSAKMTKLEDILYGSSTADATLPTPDSIISQLNAVT